MYITRCQRENPEITLKMLDLYKHEDMNLQDKWGRTLAMLIAEYQKKNPEITLKMLDLYKHEDMNLQDKLRRTLAMLIDKYQRKNPEITLKMLELCKDIFSIEYKLTDEERKLYFESLKKIPQHLHIEEVNDKVNDKEMDIECCITFKHCKYMIYIDTCDKKHYYFPCTENIDWLSNNKKCAYCMKKF